MTATTHSTGDEPRENPGEETNLPEHEIIPGHDVGGVLVGVASHLCSNCGAVLATDQKYCVECGTRRGTPRFRVAAAVDHHTAQSHLHRLHAPAVPVPAPAALSSRLMALLALIVVLAAIAVGFLIGNSSSSTTVRLTGVSGVASSSTAGSSTSGGGSSSGGGSASKSGSSKTSSSGSACAAGSPGCKNGKQTGNFFGS
jgi:hypothetical protein